VTAPYRVPQSGRSSNSPGDPFADLGDIAPHDPLGDLQDIATPRHSSSTEILARNEAGRLRDAAAAEPGAWDQVKEGVRSAYQGVRHLPSTVKGMATHAVEDLGTVASAMDAGMGQPSDLTPARAEEVPRAIMNTAANVLLPLAPASGVLRRSAINATLGAANDAAQPLRGASAALLLGETLHQAPNVIPTRVRPPRVRLDEASEPTRNATFWQTMDEGAKAQTVRGVEPLAGYEPTAVRARTPSVNPRKPAGFIAGADPFADLGDIAPSLPRQKPLAVVTPLGDVAAMADDNASRLDGAQKASAAELQAKLDGERARIAARDAQVDEFWRPIDAAQEEATRQAALRALTGVKRRARNDAAPDGAPISREALNPKIDAADPFGDLVDSTQPEPSQSTTAARIPLPSYPEGFTMGGPEGRIPDFTPPRVRGSDPLTLPDGVTPETVELAKSVGPNRYRGHETEALAESALQVQEAIQTAQGDIVRARQRGLVGEEAQADMENRGSSYSEESEGPSRTAERALAAAKSRMGQIEREFALRGYVGDDLADVMQGARERRMEQQGAAEESHLGLVMGDDPFADVPDEAPTLGAVPGAPVETMGALPVGVPRRTTSLLNPAGFAEELRPQVAEADAALAANGVTKMRVSLDEQRAQAEPLRRSLAADLGMSVLDMDAQKAGRLTGAEIVALKEAAGQSMDQITALTKQLADPALSVADREGVATLLDNARAARDGLLQRVVTASSQKGRDLAFLRQVAQRTLDPDVWMVNAKRALGDRPLTDEIVVSLNKLVREAADACGGGVS
jgi:hypothetical protein